MQELLDGFTAYLIDRKKKSRNTVMGYRSDIIKYIEYLNKIGIKKISKTDKMTVVTYLLNTKKSGKSDATVARILASIRAFYSYIIGNVTKMEDPSENIEIPRAEKKNPNFLTAKEVEILLKEPSDFSPKGSRDKAMLELLYATGIKVSELVEINIDDINLAHGLLRCKGSNGERILPIGRKAGAAIKNYLDFGRDKLTINDSAKSLFVNRNGGKLSRQGFWKILKHYGKSAGISKDITPYTIRHSFAMHLLENGADLEAIRQLLGHNDITATQVYEKMIDGHIREVYKKTHPRA